MNKSDCVKKPEVSWHVVMAGSIRFSHSTEREIVRKYDRWKVDIPQWENGLSCGREKVFQMVGKNISERIENSERVCVITIRKSFF